MAPLSVVIVSWNRSAVTLACLRRLQAWEPPADIVVVDNGSRDGTADAIAAELSGVRLIRSTENRGYGAGINLALGALAGGHVLLLNDDAGLEADDARRLVECLERHPGIGVLGPLVVDGPGSARVIGAGGRDVSRWVRTNLDGRDHPADRLAVDEPIEVDYVPGTVALVREGLFTRIGPLAENYFFGGEMADFCDRARTAGSASAILPTARAWHRVDQAGARREELYPYYILRNRFLYLRRRRPPAWRLRALLWVAYGVASATRCLLTGRGRRARAEMLALADALRGRFGGRQESLGA